MTIAQIDCFPITFRLKNPYSIAYESYDTAENLLVRIETSAGLVGWGNAAPDVHVTGETFTQVSKVLAESLVPHLIGRDARCVAALDELARQKVPYAPAARAAIDMAFYDLLGQRAGLPLYQLLGFARPRILTSITIGIMSIEEGVRQAKEFVKSGFRALKIKTGRDWKEDVERVRAIRQTVGPTIALRIDANQGYNAEDAIQMIRELPECQIEFVEQPTPANAWADLKAVHDASPVPIMADESVRSARDVFNLAANKIVDLVNLKLMKTGGITGAIQAAEVATTAGVGIMLGCMDESRLSIAAAVHLACALPGVQYADLDGSFDIRDDVAMGGFELKDGFLLPVDRPGLGIEVKI
ncbi:MAG: dipeptide epimerase [candidate division KSB1 bacterium]|nr:dipeptide epimerase [candidate division KSB1 bacterium]MDZ7302494.1 dipeptide epimerase [candidate division KSB1 bacterium]MDZ7311910.1 dipeptide epimerase [candidate division KSB1 bacterium]